MKNREHNDKKDALVKMQHLCSTREKCSHDVREKLKDMGLSGEDTEWVTAKLKEDRFIDDERYTGFFVNDKFRLNHWGKVKIRNSLQYKRIDPLIVTEALAAIGEDEYLEVLKDELIKKNRTIKDVDVYKRKARLFHFAAGRGFEQGLVYDLLSEILKVGDGDL